MEDVEHSIVKFMIATDVQNAFKGSYMTKLVIIAMILTASPQLMANVKNVSQIATMNLFSIDASKST